MSNSIWKTPDQKPENYQSIMFITKNKSTRAGVFKDGFYYDDANNQYEDDELECWATIYDVKAQADKAERLQIKVDELEHIKDGWAKFSEQKSEQIQRLQKAVDLAVHSFNEICAGVPSDIWVFDEATRATNEIKQLIKE